jgi:cytochrome subunit of sulfide dehydrogenase
MHSTLKKSFFSCLVALLLLPGLASSQPAKAAPADFQSNLWAVSCMACHGTDGHAEGVGLSLYGKTSEELTQALLDYKSGKRSGTIMPQHAKGYSDSELKRIAQFFGQIK